MPIFDNLDQSTQNALFEDDTDTLSELSLLELRSMNSIIQHHLQTQQLQLNYTSNSNSN